MEPLLLQNPKSKCSINPSRLILISHQCVALFTLLLNDIIRPQLLKKKKENDLLSLSLSYQLYINGLIKLLKMETKNCIRYFFKVQWACAFSSCSSKNSASNLSDSTQESPSWIAKRPNPNTIKYSTKSLFKRVSLNERKAENFLSQQDRFIYLTGQFFS